MKRITIVLILIIFFSGCVSTVYVSSITDQNYSPKKIDPIYIILDEDARISERQFYTILKEEMLKNEFNVVDNINQAKYYLLFNTDTNTSKINSTLYFPSTSTTSGYVGNTYYSGTTTTTNAIPYSYNYTVEKIYLDLYVKDPKVNKYFTVWEGYIGAEKDDYEKYTRAVLKCLLDVFGTNFADEQYIDMTY